MNKMKYIFIVMLCTGLFLQVQSQSVKKFRVNPGEQVIKVIPAEDIYTYPQFMLGQVQFKNGKLGSAKMNYNSLLGEIEFIDDKNDTIALDDVESMHYVAINSDTFYYFKRYLRQLSNKNGVKLAENKEIDVINREKVGGFGETNGGSVEVKESVSANSSQMKTLVAKQILTLSENFVYFFGDRFNKFRQANRKNIMDMFGKMKPDLGKYLDDNKLNYFDKNDMTRLAEYLQQ
jgi:hypothetical protein